MLIGGSLSLLGGGGGRVGVTGDPGARICGSGCCAEQRTGSVSSSAKKIFFIYLNWVELESDQI